MSKECLGASQCNSNGYHLTWYGNQWVYESTVFVTVIAGVNAGTGSVLWIGLELGNSSLVSVTSQELCFKAASTCTELFGESKLLMLMTKLCCH